MPLRSALTASRSVIGSTSASASVSASGKCIRASITAQRSFGTLRRPLLDTHLPSHNLRYRYPSPVKRSFASSSKALAGGEAAPAPGAGIAITELTTSQYEEISERDMETLNESLEMLCEDLGAGEWEVEYSSGVLNLSLAPHGQYVVNKQPPNQQIWISSPLSGPSRFGYSGDAEGKTQGTWVHHRREGVTLGGLLDKEIREIMERSSISEHWEGTGLK